MATCAVLLVSSSSAQTVDALLEELARHDNWRAERSATLIWQVETGIDDSHAAPSAPSFPNVTDGAPLEQGGSYFIPPEYRAWFERRRVRVALRSSRDDHPIDQLLLSLAESWGNESVAILALPTLEDGECGLRIIRAVGGIARHQALPPSLAMTRPARDLATASAPPAAIAAPPDTAAPPAAPAVPRRASRMARALAPPAQWLERMRRACEQAADNARQQGRQRLRAWVPKCRTGGTAYATAMLLSDIVARQRMIARLTVFATGDDRDALSIARVGRYPAHAALGMDPELRSRYTFDEGDTIRISESLAKTCIFKRREVMRDPAPVDLDLVICHRVFDGIMPGQHADLVDELHYSLRPNALLLALDCVELFPEHLFEPIADGLFRARPVPPRAYVRRRSALASTEDAAPPERALSAESGPCSSSARGLPDLEAALHGVGIPIILCNATLRLTFLSLQAQQWFELLPTDLGAELVALGERLPGGSDLVETVRNVIAREVPEELSIRLARRTFLARVVPTRDRVQGGASITFADVTQLAQAKAEAMAQRLQHAAIARLGELALGPADLAQLYEQALTALLANINACSAGIIVELAPAPGHFDVVASRGLGTDPMRTLRGMGDAGALLEAVVERGCPVSQAGERANWSDTETLASAWEAPSTTARQALATLQAGIACPISGDGELLGVLALYGRRASVDDLDRQHFVQAMANVLGGAIVRRRTRRRIALELEVSRLLAGATDLRSMGEGLRHALLAALSADSIEIWAARDTHPPSWARLFPILEAAIPEPPWPATLVQPARSEPLFGAHGSEGSELLVPIRARERPLAMLRVRGKGLGAPDRELAAGLQSIGRMLADFFDRLHILHVSRQNELSYRQKSAELEALYASLPVGVSIHDRNGVIRHVNRHLAAFEEAPPTSSGAHPLQRLYAQQVPVWVEQVLGLGAPIHDIELSLAAEGQVLSWLCNFAL